MHVDDARAMARELMDEHGLHDWRLVLDRARTRAGVCRPARREIGLSRVLTELHTQPEVRETVLHEVAHALVGAHHGHDAVWRARARAIGATGARTVAADAARPPAPWVGTCPAGHEARRHRRPQRVVSCSRCSPRFDPGAVVLWRLHGQVVPMPAQYEAELALLSAAGRAGAGGPPPPIPVGTPVRLVGRHRYTGLVGRLEKRGRTRYHVRTPVGLVTASFALVEPCWSQGASTAAEAP